MVLNQESVAHLGTVGKFQGVHQAGLALDLLGPKAEAHLGLKPGALSPSTQGWSWSLSNLASQGPLWHEALGNYPASYLLTLALAFLCRKTVVVQVGHGVFIACWSLGKKKVENPWFRGVSLNYCYKGSCGWRLGLRISTSSRISRQVT